MDRRTRQKQASVLFAMLTVAIASCNADDPGDGVKSKRAWKSLAEERGGTPVPTSTWRSRFHDVRVTYARPWEIITTPDDSPEDLLVGFIDYSDGKSYTIKVTEDSGKVSDAVYYEMIELQMQLPDSENRLIGQQDVQFHGALYRRMRFEMFTKKWGRLCMHAYILRSKGNVVIVQIAFPFDEHLVSRAELPDEVKQLDDGVTLPSEA